jgi:hypothetical protein
MLHKVLSGKALRQHVSSLLLPGARPLAARFHKTLQPLASIGGPRLCSISAASAAAPLFTDTPTTPTSTTSNTPQGRSREYPDEPRVGVGIVVFRRPVLQPDSAEVSPPCSADAVSCFPVLWDNQSPGSSPSSSIQPDGPDSRLHISDVLGLLYYCLMPYANWPPLG